MPEIKNHEIGTSLKIGVLALQGGFSEHIGHLEKLRKLMQENNAVEGKLDLTILPVKTVAQLKGVDGLIIPGGETTAMHIFLQQNNYELLHALRAFALEKPTFGTCAGLIMLANQVEGQMKIGQDFIGGLDIKVCRNYYGSQKQSFEAHLELHDELLGSSLTPMIFIRAPGILTFDTTRVTILARHNEQPVAVRQSHLIGISFHPELTADLTWHSYFVKMVFDYKIMRNVKPFC